MKRILLFCALIISMGISAKGIHHNRAYYTDWATTIAKSEMTHNPSLWMADFVTTPKWDYTQGLIAKAMLQVYLETEDSTILNYVQDFADYFIDEKGIIKTYKLSNYNLDRVNGGNFLFELYRLNPQEKYWLAIELLRSQLQTQPRNSDGGFWHKQIYPHQMWLDGLYMAEPFYARYACERNKPELFDDITRQFIVVDAHTLNTKTGLNYHGYDESREQEWANKETGCSAHTWGRAEGWYLMGIVDVLDYLPANHPNRQQLIDILQRVCKSLLKYQSKNGMWYQVPDLPKRAGNYEESTCTAMFCYTMAKGSRRGYLDGKYLQYAQKAFDGLIGKMRQEEDGTWSLTRCCAVAGLGGNPYRSGTYDYYVNEKIRDNDPKGIGPFIMAALELGKSVADIVVAADGTGDFTSVQEAINAVPDYRKTRTIIRIKKGTYHEKVSIPQNKTLISLIGDNAINTILTYNNSAYTVGCFGEKLGTSGSATLYASADDLYVENLTIENAAGDGHQVGQAVAAHVSGQRVVFNKCRFLGFQDTLFTYKEGSRQYYDHCYIEGTTDFIFGWATAVFNHCEIHSKANSYITAASTPKEQAYGYVFMNCNLTAETGVNACYLGRPWRPYAKTVFMNCDIGKHILPEGWHDWKKVEARVTSFYAEYECKGEGADRNKRVNWGKEITAQEAENYTLRNILGGEDGWNPNQIQVYYRRR